MTNNQWRTISDCPDYEVSWFGEVRRRIGARTSRVGRYIKPWVSSTRGYLLVSLCRNKKRQHYLVHRLVAITFLPPCPSPEHQVAHNDGTKINNHVSNLRWATRSENMADKKKHGTYNNGANNSFAKFTWAQADAIREARKKNPDDPFRLLAKKFCTSRQTISSIVNNRRYVRLIT